MSNGEVHMVVVGRLLDILLGKFSGLKILLFHASQLNRLILHGQSHFMMTWFTWRDVELLG